MKRTPLDAWVARKTGCKQHILSRSHIEAYQLRKMQETLNLARRNSAFYRHHLAGCPGEISSLQHLSQFPFTSADDIRRQPLRLVCVSQSDISRVVTLDTSGTSGSPKRIFFTKEDQELTVDFFHVGMSTLAKKGDVVLILLPCQKEGSVGDLLAKALLRLGAQPIKHGAVRDAAEVLKLIRKRHIDCLVGVPVQVLQIERWRECNGEAPIIMKSMLLTTDNVPPSIVSTLQQQWGASVFNHYGMTEMGLGGGVQCAALKGYHLREADMYFEIVDPDSGKPLADGEYGEVVFTTLTRRAMPLIRYRTGDISRFIPADCPCGTCLKSLEVVRDRLCGVVKLAGARLAMSQLDDALFALPGVLNFSASLSCDSCPTLKIRVERPGFPEQATRQAVMEALQALDAVNDSLKSGRLRLLIEQGAIEKGSMAKRTILRDEIKL